MRPPLEETFRNYVEVYTTNSQPAQNFNFSLRDFYREFAGSKSPGYPRTKRYNNLHVFKSEALVRAQGMVLRRTEKTKPTAWDDINFVYRAPTLEQPSSMPYSFGNVIHDPAGWETAIGRAMDQVKDQKINFAQSVAERMQVANLVGDTARRIALAMKSIRRGDVAGVRKALGLHGNKRSKYPSVLTGNVATDWLSFQYGWKPLLADVKGAAEYLAERELKHPLRIKVRAKYKSSSPPAIAYNDVIGCTNAALWAFEPRQTTTSCILEFNVENDFQRQAARLGVSDPLTLAWELVPYSFVVDWFLPIGDFLNRLHYDDGLVYQDGAVTQHSVQQCSVRVLSGRYDGGFRWLDMSGGLTTYKSLRLDRTVLTSAPRPYLPGLKDPFSATHALNALALMAVSFGRPKQFEAVTRGIPPRSTPSARQAYFPQTYSHL
jgi:hypothetical protein